MRSKAVSGFMLILLFFGMLPLVFYIQPVEASGTIYIRADGSIDPPTANITTVDNVTYTFTDNNYDSIVVERSNIIVDGNGYTLQGTGSGIGIDLTGRINVTIKNINIKDFGYSVHLSSSSFCTVSENNITIEGQVSLDHSSNNIISGNYLTGEGGSSVVSLYESSNNTISGNNMTNNAGGISVYSSSNNTIFGNNITKNTFSGISIGASSNYNTVSGNYFTGNSYAIGISDSSYNTISGNNLHANVGFYGSNGIRVHNSSCNDVIGNNITDTGGTGYGHYNSALTIVDSSSFNIFSANNLIANDVGVWTELSPKNSFYHNNFINNTIQVVADNQSINIWDHSYTSGGNYWSNYGGLDLYGGPYQNETGSDGIGDTPYAIDANNTDFYPLMSPYPSIHAVSAEVIRQKTVLAQGFTTKLYVHIANGHFTETFNATAYANSTVIDTLTNITLTSGNSEIITLTWNTTGFDKGNYNASVYATPVFGELYTEDNTYTYWVLVTIVGDVDGDRDVDVGDQRKVQLAMFTIPGEPDWDPNADIDCDEDVDVGDQRKQQLHMFESW